jgi:L-asparaginase II
MPSYEPLVELTRGPLVESIHFGALAVVDASGRLVASYGSPSLMANLRSSAKPFQALSLVESGGAEALGLSDREVAIACASHSGTDEHVRVLQGFQARIGIQESDLRCGVHYPMDEASAQALRARGEKPTPNRHNCSGKHTGMLANCRSRGMSIEDYLNTAHPIQQIILRTFAEMVGLPPEEVPVGIDGCSAPTFAAPLRNAAHAYALLADPASLSEPRQSALRRIARAMTSNPDMVGGPERWDTLIMQVTGGRVVSKGGAEGYQGMAVMPGALGKGSPALGIAIKISDGDLAGRAVGTAALAVLCQLGVLNAEERSAMHNFDRRPLYNWREIEIGEIRAGFELKKESPLVKGDKKTSPIGGRRDS